MCLTVNFDTPSLHMFPQWTSTFPTLALTGLRMMVEGDRIIDYDNFQ